MKTVIKTLVFALIFFSSLIAYADEWNVIKEKAKGQTVYFNAWGGSDTINSYIRWVSNEVKLKYGVTVKHVKVTDIGNAVSRILAEKSANKYDG